MKFKKTYSNYQTESYESNIFLWNNCKIKISVNMQYHTFLKYWHVNYSLNYGFGFNYVVLLNGKSYIDKRKEARKEAMQFMSNANINDLDKIKESDFYKKSIIEESRV